MEQFKRVQDLECQKKQKALDYEATLQALVDFYLAHKDPMQKSQPKLGARLVREKESFKASPEVGRKNPPKTLTPARNHFILRQNQAQCTHRDPDGGRCLEKRWLHIHHLKGRALGGTHTVDNLTVLCAAHHRMHHISPG